MRFENGLHTYGGRYDRKGKEPDNSDEKEISSALMIDKDAVRSFCRTHSIEPASDSIHSFCPECGKEITPSSKGRTRRFCSEKCRRAWWKRNRLKEKRSEESTRRAVCLNCGKEFISYTDGRKFCSHKCYIEHRFGGHDERG